MIFSPPVLEAEGMYPKAGPVTGTLIRSVIAFIKSQGVSLPIASDILIALSGGSDSVALAHLLIHYGRRIAQRNQFTLLHVNHGWRGVESDQDEDWVKQLGASWEVPVVTHRLDPDSFLSLKGASWEERARAARKAIYQAEVDQRRESKRGGAILFTAHQADDLAETVLWRLSTGAAQTHGGGILFRHQNEMRPLLTVRKSVLKCYLNEVGQNYREDVTNQDRRFLRAQMRATLLPEIEKIFPKAIDHLGAFALNIQKNARKQGL